MRAQSKHPGIRQEVAADLADYLAGGGSGHTPARLRLHAVDQWPAFRWKKQEDPHAFTHSGVRYHSFSRGRRPWRA